MDRDSIGSSVPEMEYNGVVAFVPFRRFRIVSGQEGSERLAALCHHRSCGLFRVELAAIGEVESSEGLHFSKEHNTLDPVEGTLP